MVLMVGCDDHVPFRDLECHVDKRSPVEMRGDLVGGCEHGPGNLQERFDLDISHEQDVPVIIEDGDGNNTIEFLDLADNFYIRIFEDSGLRDK